MDLTGLSRNSKVAPMLVRLYDSHKLYSLAKDKKPLARTELSGAVCELLDTTHTTREGELISDVLISLIRQAEKDLKEALSEKLATMTNVPLRVALHLANDEIDVARPMLSKSLVLGDLDLIYIIKCKDKDYWQAIATRQAMSDRLINILAETKENGTAQKLLENNNIVIPDISLKIIAELAERSDVVARSLLQRKEVDSALASALYRAVGQQLKDYILKNFEVDSAVLIEHVEDAVIEFDDVAYNHFLPRSIMLDTALRQQEKGILTVPSMIGTLRRGQIQTFIAQFAAYTSLPAEQIASTLTEKEGKTLALVCKAFDILKSDFVTIFLLTNRMRSSGQMVDMADVSRVVGYYNKADAIKAREVIGGKLN